MKLLVVSENYFPYGSAMASRILAFCKLFKDLKYDFHVISLHGNNANELKDDISFEIVNPNEKTSVETYIGNKTFVRRVKEYINQNTLDYVFMISVHMHFNEINNICKKNNIKTIYELGEWYDPSSYKFGKFDIRYLKFVNNINNNYCNVDGMILISRLLYKHFETKNRNICRIPSICDVKNKKYSYDVDNTKIHMVFAGSTSKSKELIKPIIQALASRQEFKEKIVFDLYGVNNNQLLKAIDNDKQLLDSLDNCVTAHGFVEQYKVEEVLSKADYQIFIRPNRRSSNAGFPTKLCESMSVATPVISNDTGDICLYLKDGKNGFVANGNKTEDLIKVLDKVINVNKKDYKKMRENARSTALKAFDYLIYADIVQDLFK